MNRNDWIRTVVAAVLLTLSFSPFPFGFLSVFALVPFLGVIDGKKPFDAFRAGYLLGFLWSALTLYWIGWPTVGGLVGALLILSLWPALFSLVIAAGISRHGARFWWTAPFVWTALEIAGSTGQLACPWNAMGNAFCGTVFMIQSAAITGVYGISFCIVLLNVLFHFMATRRSGKLRTSLLASAAAVLLVSQAVFGWHVLSKQPADGKGIRVALVQGNVDAYKKWTYSFIDSNFTIYGRMTLQAAAHKPDLIVWPETATPCYLRHQSARWRWIQSLVDSLSVPVLTGTPDYAWTDAEQIKTYNAAFLFEPRSQGVQYYYKTHLVPLSEKVPFSERAPKLGEWINRLIPDSGEYSAGDSATVFSFSRGHAERAAFSVAICFESIFPRLVSRFVNRGAGFIVVITNDGWFGNTSGPRQHAGIAVLRAVENRRWVARCANTGISEFIDPCGRVVQKTAWNEAAVLVQTVTPSGRLTFYTRHASGISSVFAAAGILSSAFILIPPLRLNSSRKKGRGLPHEKK